MLVAEFKIGQLIYDGYNECYYIPLFIGDRAECVTHYIESFSATVLNVTNLSIESYYITPVAVEDDQVICGATC
jgi:hypothetical protein